MKVGLLTSEKFELSKSPLVSLYNYLLSKGIGSQITSPWLINPDISSVRGYDAVIVRILEREYLWLAQYLEEMGTVVINSYRALCLSSNKLISDEIMKRSGLKIPRTVFALKKRILENVDGSMFPALVKPLYGRSKGIIYAKSVESLKDLRKKWIYLQKFIPNNDGVTRIYKIGKVVKSFFYPNEGKAWQVFLPDEVMEGALRCFDSMEMAIGGMDLIEGKDGHYALEVNDFPAGVKRIENWQELIADYLVETVCAIGQGEISSYDPEKRMEFTQKVS
ncbi:MAG: RimK family alpha-L-glutamate ligase [bacterium]